MKALVTGGGGFLGLAIVRKLLERGDAVQSISRSRYAELDKLGVEQFQGNIADADAVSKAAAGCDIVFHVAAKADTWGPKQEFWDANVVGTRNVISACRKHGIGRIVHTSSPSVVHTGKDLEGVDESAPIPRHFEAEYPATKAISEQEMLAASDGKLATVALRPHLIWGPGDNHLVPRLVARAKAGTVRFIGDGMKLVDVTYIDNTVDAHIAAGDRLSPGSAISGKAYFLSQDEPVAMKVFINQIFEAAGMPPLHKHAPYWLIYPIACALESGSKALGRRKEPRLTRFVVKQMATAHWFDISAAKRDLGYVPAVSTAEGLKRLAIWLRERDAHASR